MIYKRVNKTLNSNIEYVESNNQGIYLCGSITGTNFAPNHGLFIHESPKSDEIYLENVLETLQIAHEKYHIMDIKTSENSYGGVEFLESFTDDVVPTFKYNVHDCLIEKKYKLHPMEKILCIEYKITNNTTKPVKITVSPCVTKRNLFSVKRQSDLKFTSHGNSNAAKINLSISENLSLYIKSPNMKYEKKESYLNGVNYDYMYDKVLKTYVEDLFIPGFFEAQVKSGNTNTFCIFVSLEDVELKTYKASDIELDISSRDDIRYKSINENYYELKQLAKTAYKLHYIDRIKKQLVLLESMPSQNLKDDYVKNMITSIEGNYLVLGRYKEAHKILESMMHKLKDETYTLTNLDRCEAMLLFIEALNRYLMITEASMEEIKEFYTYIKTNIYEYLDKKSKYIYADTDLLLMVEGKKYIKINALWYNALRIFVDLADKFKEESEFIYTLSETVRENISSSFWDDKRCVLKYEISEQSYPTIDMLYVLSLSYPVLKDNNISMKLMDTAFKELYTAYGMRLGGVNTNIYDGYVYPHLMVHFLKANLRQMGVTRASQKLAYNLVKEIFQEIGKKTVGTVAFKYDEKTKKTYGTTISAMTNAELIRAFELLT